MKLAAFNFFPAFTPPRSGGELRYVHLFRRLARWYDVELASPTYPEHARETIEHAPTLREHRFPKTGRYVFWHRFFDRVAHFRECSGLVTALAAPSHSDFAREARRMAQEADILIHEFPYLYPFARKARPGQLLVYDAHNVEARLARDMFHGLIGAWAVRRVRSLERRCAQAADLVLACSEDDALALASLYRLDPLKIRVVPNGVDPDEIRPAPESQRPAIRQRLQLDPKRPAILFLGSFHPPNIEAVEFLRDSLAPTLPGVDFLVAGRVSSALDGRPTPRNLRVLGAIDEATKTDLLQGCDAAINPMFSGSGTNLKMLEYLAAGLPTLSTPRGARGLHIEHRRHALVVGEERLVEGLQEVVSDPALCRVLAREAREHVCARFSWDAIADTLHEILTIKTHRRVLVLNDFPVSPVQSGGQARLLAVGQRLAETGHGVTILTLSTDATPAHRRLGPNLEELNVPRSPALRAVDLWLYHRIGVGADDVSAYLFSWLSRRFSRLLRREARLASAAVFSHCYLIKLHQRLPRHAVVIHDAYNVESDLKRQMYNQSRIARFLLRAVRRAELAALQTAAFTSCVSLEDERVFRELYPEARTRYVLAPNGVDGRGISALARSERRLLRGACGLAREPVALFLASGHPPNAEAARFILQSLAPALPEVLFLLVGQVCGWFVAHPCPPNALLLGVVPDAVKDFLLQTSDLALNPMFQGSGTNIKIFDYLAAGLPTITTPIGARGINHAGDDVLLVREPEEFASAIRGLLQSPETLDTLAQRCRQQALERYDWSISLQEFTSTVETLVEAAPKATRASAETR